MEQIRRDLFHFPAPVLMVESHPSYLQVKIYIHITSFL